MATITFTGTLVCTRCWCGIEMAIPKALWDHLHESSRNSCYCPLGHQFIYNDAKDKRVENAEQEAIRLRARLDQAQAEAEHQRNRVNGYRGALTKAKKRAAAGVCPAAGCKRHFQNVAAHVQRMHPDLAAAEPVEVVVVK